MGEIISSIGALWTKFSDIFYLVYTYLENLVVTLDSVDFTADSLVYDFFGAIHYVLGDGMYSILCIVLTVGASFLLYKLFKKAFNLIISLIPGIKGGAI